MNQEGLIGRVLAAVLEHEGRHQQAASAGMTLDEFEKALSAPPMREVLEGAARTFYRMAKAIEDIGDDRDRISVRVLAMTSEQQTRRIHELIAKAGWALVPISQKG